MKICLGSGCGDSKRSQILFGILYPGPSVGCMRMVGIPRLWLELQVDIMMDRYF